MYKFYTWDISVKFTLFITVVYVTGNYGFVKSKRLCHLALCEPHCIILQLHVQLYASVLKAVYFY